MACPCSRLGTSLSSPPEWAAAETAARVRDSYRGAFDFTAMRSNQIQGRRPILLPSVHTGLRGFQMALLILLMFLVGGLQSSRVGKPGTCQSSCFTELETEAQKQLSDLFRATWLSSSGAKVRSEAFYLPVPSSFLSSLCRQMPSAIGSSSVPRLHRSENPRKLWKWLISC